VQEKETDSNKIRSNRKSFPSIELLIFCSSGGMLLNLLVALAVGLDNPTSAHLLAISAVLALVAVFLTNFLVD